MEGKAMPAGPVLVVPGLGGSGPQHWQSHMAAVLKAGRVEQADWNNPDLTHWLAGVDEAIDAQRTREPRQKIILAAHSLGCILAAHWMTIYAQKASECLRGALLVAPADVDSPAHTPDDVRGFGPIPQQRLPIPTLVVFSQSDPYCSAERARAMAAAWGSSLCDIGDAGHINVDAGYGPWPLGMALLRRF